MSLVTTWDEIRMTVLHKLFLATSSDNVTENDSNRDYLKAMPEEYNAAVMLLSTTNRYIIKYFEVPSYGDGGTMIVDLKEYAKDLYQIQPNEAYLFGEDGIAERYTKMKTVGGDLLYLDGGNIGVYRIYYYAYPVKATSNTQGNTDMQLDPEVAVLVPLYMASQLYKDDDIAIATQYRNEFEVGRELLVKERNTSFGSKFSSVTGWW